MDAADILQLPAYEPRVDDSSRLSLQVTDQAAAAVSLVPHLRLDTAALGLERCGGRIDGGGRLRPRLLAEDAGEQRRSLLLFLCPTWR